MRKSFWIAMVAALPSVAWADGVKLTAQKEKGLEFSSPAGWAIDVLEDLSKVVLTEPGKQGTITYQSITKKDISVGDWVKMMTPGGKPKETAGWTCAESDPADKTNNGERVATCGQVREGLLLFVGLTAEPALYKKVGGVKLVQKLAAGAKGLKAPDAGE
jgi:hypothetical protein